MGGDAKGMFTLVVAWFPTMHLSKKSVCVGGGGEIDFVRCL